MVVRFPLNKELAMSSPRIVGQNIDTFIGNARLSGEFPDDLAGQLEDLKRRSQEAEEDIPTLWHFAGERSSSSSHMGRDDSGSGFCIRPVFMSMWG
jgi:hypothetical protein